MDERDVRAHDQLPQFEPGLFFDGSQRANWNVAFWVRDGYAAQLFRMLELNVAAFLSNPIPASDLKRRNYVADFHRCIYTHQLTYIQVYKYT